MISDTEELPDSEEKKRASDKSVSQNLEHNPQRFEVSHTENDPELNN